MYLHYFTHSINITISQKILSFYGKYVRFRPHFKLTLKISKLLSFQIEIDTVILYSIKNTEF